MREFSRQFPPTPTLMKSCASSGFMESGAPERSIANLCGADEEKIRASGLMSEYVPALIEPEKTEQAKTLLYRILREYPNNLLARGLLAPIYIRDKD